MTATDNESAPEDASGGDGASSYPELPPGTPPPPEIDSEGEAKYLRDHADLLAGVDLLDEDTRTDVPLDPERAAEMRHEALQQEIGRWSHAVRNAINALLQQRRAAVATLTNEIRALDEEIAARQDDMERYDAETAAHDPTSRFAGGAPLTWLLAPFALGILEYPVVNPAVGRLFDVAGRAQMLATVAVVIGQVVLYELTGATAQRWRASRGTLTERRAVASVMVASLSLSVLFIVGLTLVRLDQLAAGGRVTAVLLLVGIQASFALLSMVSGWKASSPEAQARRGIVEEIERLRQEREAIHEDRSTEEQRVEYLDGLLAAWGSWTRKHRESIRAEYLGQVHSFRAYFKAALARHGRKDAVYWLERIPLPAFTIPSDDSERY